jgi:hypothetical protein
MKLLGIILLTYVIITSAWLVSKIPGVYHELATVELTQPSGTADVLNNVGDLALMHDKDGTPLGWYIYSEKGEWLKLDNAPRQIEWWQKPGVWI